MEDAIEAGEASDKALVETVTETPSGNVIDPTKHGQGIRALVDARKGELELALIRAQRVPGGSTSVAGVAEALDALAGMLTGNLDQISATTASEMMHWLQTSKHLAEGPAAPIVSPPASPEQQPQP